ncbi:MAG: polysulfide reductase, partial [Acidimicrobiales bacterium]
SVGALIHDLGRPKRFLHMLRVFKPTSPLSVGSWILMPFGSLAGLAAVSEITGIAPGIGRLAGFGAGLVGPPLTTYTAVLLADTAVPAWHEAHRHLPFVFAGSSLASGAGAGLLVAPSAQAAPARRLAVAGAMLELAATAMLEHGVGLPSGAYRAPAPARLLRLARVLTLAGAVTAVAGRRSRPLSALAGVALVAGSVCTRFGIYQAGLVSAADPMDTVLPQRQRREAGGGRRAASPAAPAVEASGGGAPRCAGTTAAPHL